MKNLGIFAMGVCLGLLFGAAISGDYYDSTTYIINNDCAEMEDDTEVTINEE